VFETWKSDQLENRRKLRQLRKAASIRAQGKSSDGDGPALVVTSGGLISMVMARRGAGYSGHVAHCAGDQCTRQCTGCSPFGGHWFTGVVSNAVAPSGHGLHAAFGADPYLKGLNDAFRFYLHARNHLCCRWRSPSRSGPGPMRRCVVDFATGRAGQTRNYLSNQPQGPRPRAALRLIRSWTETGCLLDYVAPIAPMQGCSPSTRPQRTDAQCDVITSPRPCMSTATKMRGSRWCKHQSSFDDMTAQVPRPWPPDADFCRK